MVNTCRICNNKQIDNDIINIYGTNWGSPIKKCMKCGSEFTDNRCVEASINDKPINKFNFRKSIYAIIGFLIGPIALILSMTTNEFSNTFYYCGIIMTGFTMFSILVFISSALNNKRKYKEEMVKSELRMKDPDYIEKLKKNGYKGFAHENLIL